LPGTSTVSKRVLSLEPRREPEIDPAFSAGQGQQGLGISKVSGSTGTERVNPADCTAWLLSGDASATEQMNDYGNNRQNQQNVNQAR
jgi:hypothetical protein